MVPLTKPQRHSLMRLYQRMRQDDLTNDPSLRENSDAYLSYRQFRRTVQPYLGGDCVIVPWGGMWIGIEKDGYAHS